MNPAYRFFGFIVLISNLMFFSTLPQRKSYRRIRRKRKRREMFESLKESRRTGHKALSSASIGKWTIINANKSAEDIEKEIIKSV